ncbi:MAG: hypothetical protein BHW17_02065 [Dorea sp. 42_8]|nr:MAG: hypothetical protein BHW17_02065 [Dorea sp. 42_8]
MADAATSAITGGGTVSGQGLNEAAVKKALKAAGVSEEMLNRYGISISDIVNGKIDSSDLAKYGISANVLDGLTGGSGSSVENVIENADIPESLQETMIKSADIPEVFKNLLLKNNNKEMYDELGVTTFPQYIGAYVARLVINIIAFILTFIVVTVIIRAVVFVNCYFILFFRNNSRRFLIMIRHFLLFRNQFPPSSASTLLPHGLV